jgi:hypothetical protein
VYEFSWQGYIRHLLGCGDFKVTASAEQAGVPELQITGHTESVDNNTGTKNEQIRQALTEILWVNASTYLPIRLAWTTAQTYVPIDAPTTYPPATGMTVTVFGWLPPTRANLTKLTAIPPGFRRINMNG